MKNDKKVGIVVPIYNVTNYLRECLDSIMNQSYKNLSVILVNDGSTDDSLNIALEYANKDQRFMIIDKQNGGLSSARNVGIDWFKGKYTTELDSKSEGDIYIYKITNENPYTIYNIYHKTDTLVCEKIDYIIFLDSDDYWVDNCIEKCIQHAQGVDIVWFDFEVFFEDIQKEWGGSIMSHFKFNESKKISRQEWLAIYVKNNIGSFYFAWSGLIDFEFLKRVGVEFLNGVIHEDHNFGLLTFIQSDNIYIVQDKLYQYRIRSNSITNNTNQVKAPYYSQAIYQAFDDFKNAKAYHKGASILLMFIEVVEHIEKWKVEGKNMEVDIVVEYFLPFYEHNSSCVLNSRIDPMNALQNTNKLMPYLTDKYNRLNLQNPTFYAVIFCAYKIYDGLKSIEKHIRYAIKGKKKR